jgi:hypothetical protein
VFIPEFTCVTPNDSSGIVTWMVELIPPIPP